MGRISNLTPSMDRIRRRPPGSRFHTSFLKWILRNRQASTAVLFPVHRWPHVVRWVSCVLLVVLPACGSLTHRFSPSVPPARSGADPALDAQTRLIDSAYRAFVQERYSLASALFQRFV